MDTSTLSSVSVGRCSADFMEHKADVRPVVPMISDLYFEGKITTIQSSDIKGALAIGMIAGQLGFGLFGDALGRHKMYGKELIVLMFGNLMVVLLPWKGLSKNGIVVWLTIFRVITGFGTGGDYPMSSALVAERGIFGSRAKSILTVFACIGVGGFVATVVNLILISAAYNAVERDIKNLEWVWRVLLGLGLVPAAASLYARLTIKETKPYEKCECPNHVRDIELISAQTWPRIRA